MLGCCSWATILPSLALACLLASVACDPRKADDADFEVSFACEADRASSDALRVVVRSGGCRGEEILYEVSLAKGEDAPLGRGVDPGRYGFEASAYREGTLVATACVEAELPSSKVPVVLLTSEACEREGATSVAIEEDSVVVERDAQATTRPQLDAGVDACTDAACDTISAAGHVAPNDTISAPRCEAEGAACSSCTTAADCADENPCTSDRCEDRVCRNDANTLACDDGKSCTANDLCANRVCAGTSLCASDATCGSAGCQCVESGKQLCGTRCVSLTTDPEHCGECGRTCAGGAVCENGGCKAASNLCTAHRYKTHDYLVCPDPLSWTSARDRCRGYGMGLAIIDDAVENAFLRAHIGSAERWIGANDRGDNGTSCKRSNEEGLWHWASPNNTSDDNFKKLCTASATVTLCPAESGAYENWRPGEPNNLGCVVCSGSCPEAQDCGLLLWDGHWGDSECGNAFGFICEAP